MLAEVSFTLTYCGGTGEKPSSSITAAYKPLYVSVNIATGGSTVIEVHYDLSRIPRVKVSPF